MVDRTKHLIEDRDYVINEFGIYMHDMIAESILGCPLRENEWVDHINGNGLDNRRANLIIFKDTVNGPIAIFGADTEDEVEEEDE